MQVLSIDSLSILSNFLAFLFILLSRNILFFLAGTDR